MFLNKGGVFIILGWIVAKTIGQKPIRIWFKKYTEVRMNKQWSDQCSKEWQWCIEHCSGDWTIGLHGFWFENEDEAIAFRLVWG